jgi:hypothetical protein
MDRPELTYLRLYSLLFHCLNGRDCAFLVKEKFYCLPKEKGRDLQVPTTIPVEKHIYLPALIWFSLWFSNELQEHGSVYENFPPF